MIPYGKQWLDAEDIASVIAALKSDYLTTGPRVAEFESLFAEYVGASHAVAVSSATAALHLCMLAMDLQPKNRVLTSPNTFLSTANAVAFAGAIPDFCDVNDAGNLDVDAMCESWDENTRGVIAVDYAGMPADMRRIAEEARSRGGFVIEDASHAIGTCFELNDVNYRTGGHPWADATVFSFHPVKTMTTGEGGMITTSDANLADRLRRLRHHGVERNPEAWVAGSDMNPGPWYYEMQELGYNYRLTDIQCALGLSQLKKIEQFISRRERIVGRYNAAFSDLIWLVTPKHENWLGECTNYRIAWHLYSPVFDFEKLGMDRNTVIQKLKEKGVGSQVLYIPVHLQPWYRKQYGYGWGKCPNAEKRFLGTLSLPLFPSMTDGNVERVIETVFELDS